MDEQLHLELVATSILQAGLWPRLLKAAKLIFKKKKSRWKLEKHIENDKKTKHQILCQQKICPSSTTKVGWVSNYCNSLTVEGD